MKWLSFVIIGFGCFLVYEMLLGLVLTGIEKATGYSPVLEALQHACAITLGFLTSYKLWPPQKKASEPEEEI